MSREIINKLAQSGFTGQGEKKAGAIVSTAGGDEGRMFEEISCSFRAALRKDT
jgi:hypothetical protein